MKVAFPADDKCSVLTSVLAIINAHQFGFACEPYMTGSHTKFNLYFIDYLECNIKTNIC